MRRPPRSTFWGVGPSPASAADAGTKLAWKAATTASTSSSGTSASATTATRAPTGSSSPSWASWRRSTPPVVTSSPPEILSVSMSQISSPAEMRSPTCRCQAVSRPFSIERPHFGTVMEWMAGMDPSSVVCDAFDGGGDSGGAGDVEVLEHVAEGHGRVRRGYHLARRLQRCEGLLRHQRGDIGGQRAARVRLVHDHHPPGLLRRLQDGGLVHRGRRPQVDDLAVDLLLRQLCGCLRGEMDHPAVGDDGDAVPFANHIGLAERDGIALLRHVALEAVEQLVLA